MLRPTRPVGVTLGRLAALGVLGLALGLGGSPAVGQAPAAETPVAAVQALLANRQWARATEVATAALAAHPEQAVDLLLLRAIARAQAGDRAAALADLTAVRSHPQAARRASKAAFRAAALLGAMERAPEALAVTQAAVAALRAPARRAEVARLYLDLVDTLLRPPRDAAATVARRAFTPDWTLAYPLLLKAEELDLAGEAAADLQLDLSRCEAELQPKGADAVARAEQLLAARPTHATTPEVRFLLGQALARAGRLEAAQAAWQTLVETHPRSPFAPRALDALAAACLSAGRTGRQGLAAAIAATERLVAGWSDDERAPGAALRLATRFAGEPALHPRALAAFEDIATRWPQHAAATAARLAEADLLTADGRLADAIALLGRFVAGRTVDAGWQKAVTRLADLRHTLAMRHWAAGGSEIPADAPDRAARERDAAGHRAAARTVWQAFLDAAPTDARVPFVLFALADLERRDGRAAEAVAAWRRLADRFPDDEQAQRARYSVAETLATVIGDYPAALEEFDALHEGTWGALAARRAAAIRSPELSLTAARVFAPGEALSVELTTRNLPSVELAAYRVDLTEHFLQTGHLRGLTDLDVALIKPDHTWTAAVTAPRPFAPIQQSVPLAPQVPAPAPGAATAWVVTARAGLLEARTVVLVSDLAAIGAASLTRTWSWAAQRDTGSAADGVVTHRAADGTLLPAGPDLPEALGAKALALLATRAEHVALVDVPLEGLASAPVLEPRAWMVTDRTGYQPGETVLVYGLVREVAAERLIAPTAGRYRCELRDLTGGRVLADVALDFSDVGSFHVAVPLDPALVGARRCRLDLVKEAGATDVVLAQRALEVAPFTPPAVRVELDAPTTPVEPGAATTAVLRITAGTGEPIVRERVPVQVGDDPEVACTTDDGGYCRVAVTSAHTAGGSVPLRATVRGDRRLYAAVPVASRSLQVEPEGALLDGIAAVAGEPFAVPLRATRGDAPAADVGLRGSLWRPDPVTGWAAVGEPAALHTNAAGRVTWTVRPTAAGPHRLRVEYDDAHGLPVRLEWVIDVAGPGDPARVRCIPAAIEVPAGTEVTVRIHSDLTERPAWIAVHGDRLWSVRRITLAPGMNRVAVALPPAPHRVARVTCLVADGAELLGPTVGFRVRHALQVDCTPDAAEYAPGAAARVQVRVLRPDGTPAAGRVMVWVCPAAEGAVVRRAVRDPAQRFLPVSDARLLAFGLSDTFAPPSTVRVRDAAIDQALAELTAAANRANAPLMVQPVDVERLVPQHRLPGMPEEPEWDDALGVGGGAGGGFGGRFGGKRDLVARGGGGRGTRRAQRASRPPVFASHELAPDAQGVVRVTVPLPLARGEYVCVAVAASGTTLFGSGDATLRVAGDWDVRVDAPAAIRASDRAGVRVQLHNRTGRAQAMAVRAALPAALGAAPAPQDVTVPADGATEVVLELAGLQAGAGDLTLTFTPAGGAPAMQAVQPLRVWPDGAIHTVGAGGWNDGPATGVVPGGRVPAALQVVVDASPAAALLTLAEQPDGVGETSDRFWAAARLWASAEALAGLPRDAAGAVPASVRARAARLRQTAERQVGHLLALYGHGARRRPSHWWNCADLEPRTEDAPLLGLTLVALSRAQHAGLRVPEGQLAALAAGLDRAFTNAETDAAKAWLLFCRAFHEPPAYAWVNRLYRQRETLDTGALALLAHVLAQGGRAAEARTVLDDLAATTTGDAGARHWAPDALAEGPVADAVTLSAVVCSAARLAGQAGPVFTEAAGWVASRRQGAGWSGPLAGVLLLRAAVAAAPGAGPPPAVEVRLGERLVGTAALDSPYASAGFTVPAAEAGAAAATLTLTPTGPGRFGWGVARMVAVDPSDPHPSVHLARRHRTRLAGRIDGDHVSAGRAVLLAGTTAAAEAADAALVPGWPVDVTVTIAWGAAAPGAYWWFEPIAAGAAVDWAGLSGVDYAVRVPGGLRVRVRRPAADTAETRWSYRLDPRWPGTYAAGAATIARSRWAAPARVADLAAAPALPVPVAVGRVGDDPAAGAPPSPDERWQAGMNAAERGEHAAVLAHLLPLADGPLDPEPFAAVARALVEAGIKTNRPGEVVRFFEALKERDPDWVVPFDRMVEVGTAYAAIGEAERGRQVFAAVADALFLQEAGAIGALEAAGHTRRAFGAAERLLAEYGDGDVVRSTLFAYAQRAFLLGRSAPATRAAAGDGYTRDELFGIATAVMRRYLAEYATDADGPAVALTLATALLEAGDYAASRQVAAEAAARDPEARFLDTFDYLQAAAAYATRDFEGALALCERLIHHDYGAHANPNPGATVALGWHLSAQVHHARGEIDAAVRAYREVAERFGDAARALRFLEREGLRVPPLTVVRGAEPVRIAVEHRGGEPLAVQVYPVDLRMLAMTHRDAQALDAVKLAGVRPALAVTVPAGAVGRSGAARPVELALPEVGAYLVVVRAGALRARGLVVRSDLAIEVQEEPTEGTVRVNVVTVDTGAAVAKASVSFVSTDEARIVTRQTDLRGIAEASGLRGTVNVVVEQGGRYAVHYGTVAHGREPVSPEQDQSAPTAATDAANPLDQLEERLKDVRSRNDANWKDNTTKEQRGVEAGRAKK